eukprot:TRINITY_DN9350_c0_g1_i1.p1 TRINITY_DN9350_c0_g1~~TRINITY_DN9350_c0_g1_i1.p1  ORF type:complete len:310 (+),score=48.84 TRINITY_DN9350_c0_g1_i1:67-930(+)
MPGSVGALCATVTWSIRQRVPVLFTPHVAKKRPTWQEGELAISDGSVKLVNEQGRTLETFTVTQAFLSAVAAGADLPGFEMHRVAVNEPSPASSLGAESSTSGLEQPVGSAASLSSAAGSASAGPRAFKRPRRMLLPPAAPPPEIQEPKPLERDRVGQRSGQQRDDEQALTRAWRDGEHRGRREQRECRQQKRRGESADLWAVCARTTVSTRSTSPSVSAARGNSVDADEVLWRQGRKNATRCENGPLAPTEQGGFGSAVAGAFALDPFASAVADASAMQLHDNVGS